MPLRNDELKQINHTITLLEVIKQFAWEEDSNDLFEKTGVTIADIEDNIKELKQLCTSQKLQKHISSVKSTEYKKLHRERRNIVQNINNAKHRKDERKLNYWSNKLKEYDEKRGE